jgi:hypothetical protein
MPEDQVENYSVYLVDSANPEILYKIFNRIKGFAGFTRPILLKQMGRGRRRLSP